MNIILLLLLLLLLLYHGRVYMANLQFLYRTDIYNLTSSKLFVLYFKRSTFMVTIIITIYNYIYMYSNVCRCACVCMCVHL